MTDFADLARLDVDATPGPWEATFSLVTTVGGSYPEDDIASTRSSVANAALIAAARNAIPEILRIREETLALHAEFTGLLYAECVECEVRFPCPTVRIWNGEG